MARKKQARGTPRRFRDRITGLKKVKASTLRAHPKNWRTHNDRQRSALEGVMSEIGFAGAVLTYEDEDGLVLVDGHLRADIADDDEIPVLLTDLTEAEAMKVLASFDVIGSMAGVDIEAFDALLAELSFDSHDLTKALTELLNASSAEVLDFDDAKPTRASGDQMQVMELQPMEHYDYVIVLARHRSDWQRLTALFGLDKVQDPNRRTRKVGLARAVDARRLLDIFDAKV